MACGTLGPELRHDPSRRMSHHHHSFDRAGRGFSAQDRRGQQAAALFMLTKLRLSELRSLEPVSVRSPFLSQ